jgi:putative flippase GtrA
MKDRILNNTFLKFAAVGVLNTLVGTAIMFGLYNLAGASYWVSSAANYILASILSYVLNKKFTFRHKGEVVQSGMRFAVNIAVCYFIAYGAAKPCAAALLDNFSISIQENTAMLAGMCIFVVLNYFGQKMFVFKCSK